MRRFLSALLAAAAVMTINPGQAAAEPPSPSILLDGLPLTFPVPPAIVDGRTLVPFRVLAEALGTEVFWHQETRTVEARGNGTEVRLTIGSKTMWVNGQPKELDVPPMLMQERTLIPLRAFGTAFGAQVDWNSDTRAVLVKSPVRPMRTMAFYAIRSYDELHLATQFSDVAFGWARLTDAGTVDLAGTDFRWPQPDGDITGERILADVGRAGTRRQLLIHATDKTGGLTALVLDNDRLQRAAGEIARVVISRGFDGVVLDLEGLGLDERGDELVRVQQGFARLVEAVAKQLRAVGKETIVSVHPLNGAYHGYDYALIGRHADMLQLMAHDYQPNGSPEPADLVDEAIRLALKQVDRSKLLLGIVTAYETPDTAPQKAGLAKRYGLAGLSVWRLGLIGTDTMAALKSTVSPQK